MAEREDQANDPAAQQGNSEGEAFAAAFAERAKDPGRETTDQAQPDGDKPSDQEPAPARSDDAPASAATSATTSEGASSFDPWTGLTPEQKSHFERLQASERSNRGRVGALTKKLNGTLTTRAAPAPQQDQQDGQPASTGEAASDLDQRLQSVVDEYGDVVGPIAEVLKEVRAEIASIKTTATTASEVEADAQELAEAYTALEGVHPDYAAIAADNNFAAWLGDQPPKVIELANSFDPREVSLALTLFKTERSAATAKLTGEGDDTGQQAGTATADKRARQLEGSRQVASRGAPAAAGVPNDFSSAFKARAASYAK